jgi:hypothetical protein
MATNQSSDIVLALIVEMVGVGAVTVIAGLSDDAGTLVLVVMLGLWLLFLINHPGVETYLNTLMANVQGALGG